MLEKPVQADLRIIAGTMRNRRIRTSVHTGLRPTPERVRGALFSILGNAVPGRMFVDVFAGTGVVGLEAISRGATSARFIEGDAKAAAAIEKYAKEWMISDRVQVMKADAYRWAERWLPPTSSTTLFLSPPFPDLSEKRIESFLGLVGLLWSKLPMDSVLVLQIETGFPLNLLPDAESWDVRTYGRNILAFRVVESGPLSEETTKSSS
jgi:16S rRNA (guanine966-N2)-methyltransferase